MVMVLVMSGSAIPAGKKTMNIFDFKGVDRNSDGHLTRKEVQEDQLDNLETPEAKAFLEKMDATEYQLKKVRTEMADKFFDAADGDKDGKITKKEANLFNEISAPLLSVNKLCAGDLAAIFHGHDATVFKPTQPTITLAGE